MALPDPPQPHEDDSVVPGLVSGYRAQLDAIRTQARDLVRMREDVLAAAERESHAIVTSARSEIRDILVKARRELLVLAAQVQAVTESEPTPELEAGSGEGRSPSDLSQERLKAAAASGARQEVRHVLTEARPDLDALTVEAKILRANLLALHSPEDRPQWATAPTPPPPPDIELTASDARTPEEPGTQTLTSLDEPEEQPLALDELPRTFGPELGEPPIDTLVDRLEPEREVAAEPAFLPAQATPSTGRVVVGAFAVLAVAAVLGTVWWVRGRGQASEVPVPVTPASQAQATPPPAVQAQDVARNEPPSPALQVPTLTIEARRESWIRAQVDGRPVTGRIFDAGETRTITGASRVSIRAGDAGAVYVAVNGAEPEVLGPTGRPLTRDYVLEGTQVDPVAPKASVPRPHEPDSPPAPDAAPVPLPAPRATAPAPPVAATVPPPVAAPQPLPVAAAPQPPPLAAPPAPARTLTAPVATSTPAPGRATAAVSTPAPSNSASLQPVTPGTPQEDELMALSQRWLDAYLTGNSSTMLAVSGGTPDIRDQRAPGERVAPGSSITARRSFETPKLQRGADIGVFSVRMTERPQGASDASQDHVALVSQVWMRRTGKWQLIDVRIVSESQVKPQ